MNLWGWLARRYLRQLPDVRPVDPDMTKRLDEQRSLWPEIRSLVQNITAAAEENNFSARIDQAFRQNRGL